MAAWSGWQDDLLSHLGFTDTAENVRFLTEWNAARPTQCANDLVNTSFDGFGGADSRLGCWTYPTRLDGMKAMSAQLHQAAYAAILAALKSGHPFTVNDWSKVADELQAWGSIEYADKYRSETQPAAGTGSIHAPHALHGWSDVQRSVNVHLRRTLKDSNRLNLRALQALSRARKVRL